MLSWDKSEFEPCFELFDIRNFFSFFGEVVIFSEYDEELSLSDSSLELSELVDGSTLSLEFSRSSRSRIFCMTRFPRRWMSIRLKAIFCATPGPLFRFLSAVSSNRTAFAEELLPRRGDGLPSRGTRKMPFA